MHSAKTRPDPAQDMASARRDAASWAAVSYVDVAFDGDHAVVRLGGEIDATNAAQIVTAGTAAIANPDITAVTIDLARVTFLASAGIGALIQLKNEADDAHRRLALRAVPVRVLKVLQMTGLTGRFYLDELDGMPGGHHDRVAEKVNDLEAREAATRAEIEQLTVALTNARRIGAAIGIVMATQLVTEEAAFEVLCKASQDSNRKVREIADSVVLTGALPK